MESSHPFYQILQALMEGIVVEDRAGQIVFVNRALEQLVGYEREELIGLHWTELIPAELREGAAGRRTAGMDEGSAPFETCLQRKDGTRTRVLVRVKPLFSGKRPQGLLSAFFPLGGRHDPPLEEMALIGQHISSVIHELNNPLTIILLQTRLLSKAAAQSPAIGKGLDTIREQVERIRRLVDDLLAFGGPRPPQLKDTDVNALIRHTLEVQSPALKDSVQMVANLAADLPRTQADPDRLQQIFVNIIHNACQAIAESRNGTGGATPKAGRVMITTTLVRNCNGHRPQIQIRFADNGTGIGPDVMPHLLSLIHI